MLTQIVLTFLFLLLFLLLLGFVELIYKRLKLPGELTRKLAHFAATLSTISFPYLFTDHWYVLVLAIIFFCLLFLSRNSRHLRSIHDITRISTGSYLLPVSIYLTFLISHLSDDRFLFILPIMILAVSDPAAGLLGMNINGYNHEIVLFGRRMRKTWLGSSAFFISAFLISLFAFYYHRQMFDLHSLGFSVFVALTATIAEMLSPKGTDNLLIPTSVVLVLICNG
jgi:phytol kinase